MSQTCLSIVIAGARYPKEASVLGIMWVIFRTLYTFGYVFVNEPEGKGRVIGTPWLFAQGALWGLAIKAIWPFMGTVLK